MNLTVLGAKGELLSRIAQFNKNIVRQAFDRRLRRLFAEENEERSRAQEGLPPTSLGRLHQTHRDLKAPGRSKIAVRFLSVVPARGADSSTQAGCRRTDAGISPKTDMNRRRGI